MILCDTNIIIEFYKNQPSVISELKKIGQENIAVSVVTTAELIYGVLNKRELNQILKDISHLSELDLTPNISKEFLNLMTQYSLSHNLTMPDALIAATSIVHDVPLFTLNLKDFRFIPSLTLYQTV